MRRAFDSEGELAGLGLNLQAVFNLDTLPADLLDALGGADRLAGFRQVILVGYGGTKLWQSVEQAGPVGDNPIDDFSRQAVAAHMNRTAPDMVFAFLYPPSDMPAPLIALGELAGWHHASPFMVGINAEWGSWYAYRVLMLADSEFDPTPSVRKASPCEACVDKPCLAACPVGAAAAAGFHASRCFDHRLAAASPCARTCLSRRACPVGVEHRYSDAQMAYHYGRSLATLKGYAARGSL